ncbi:MAG: universal stress protein [Sphingomonadales bacterium]|nr:universal stress protein [Sphingomonadales bacterium]
MLATDLSARCDRACKRTVLLADQLDREIVVAHVIEGKKRRGDAETEEMLIAALIQKQFNKTDRLAQTIVLRGSVPQTLADAARDARCDLIVTGIARLNSLRDHILGTAVDYLVRQASVPVLIVKEIAEGPYRRLMVATDLSSCSRAALETALALFPKAKIDLVHAYHTPYEGFLRSEQIVDDVRREAEEDVQRFLRSPSLPAGTRRRIKAKAMVGELAIVMKQALDRSEPDLVVLGTHGKSGFVHATIGSRAAELLSWLPCDVLMVRNNPVS